MDKPDFKIILISLVLIIGFPFMVKGLDSLPSITIYPKRLSFSYGIGSFAMKDHFFSIQKYSGKMPVTSLEWMCPHKNHGFRIGVEFKSSDDIKNHSLSTAVSQFSFYQDYLYPIGSIGLFKKDVGVFIGPSFDMYFYYNQQQFAESGIYFDFSFLMLISAATDVYFNMPLNEKWKIEGNLRQSILSLGIQMPEVFIEQDSEAGTTVKFLNPINGLRTNFDFGVRYFFLKRLSVGISYGLEITNVSIRKQLTSVSDQFIAGVSLNF